MDEKISEADKIKLKFDAIWKARDNEISAIKERSLLVWGFLMFCYGGYGILARDLLDKTPTSDIRFQAYNLALFFLSLVCFCLSAYWTKMMKGAKAWAENFDFIAEAFQHKFFRLSNKATSCPYAQKLKFGMPGMDLDSMFHRKDCQNCQQDPSYACVFSVTDPGTLYYPDVDRCLLSDKGGAFSPAGVTIAIAILSMLIAFILTFCHGAIAFMERKGAISFLAEKIELFNFHVPVPAAIVVALTAIFLLLVCLKTQTSMGLLDIGKVNGHCHKCLSQWNKIGGRKKKKSKSYACKIATLLLTFCFSLTSYADTETINGITWKFDIINNEAVLSSGPRDSETSGAISIPSTLGGCPVSSIGKGAFYYRDSLTKVSIPSSVTRIGDHAFSRCLSLETVFIPNSVVSIGESAFEACRSLKTDTETIPGLEILSGWIIGRSLSTVPTRLVLSGVRGICDGLLRSCPAILEEVDTGDVLYIGDFAFANQGRLSSIKISKSVNRIGDAAFADCSSLEQITVEQDNSNYSFENDVLISKDGEVILRCVATTKDLIISEGVTTILNHAFSGCSSLVSVIIPTSVTSIGDYAFSGCSGLRSVTIPDSVTSIGDSTFSGCSGLMSVTIPNSVTSIGDWAFQDCSGLTSVTIPDSVTSIGDGAFSGCFGLTSVTIPDSVTSIGDGAFSGCFDLTEIIIPRHLAKFANSITSGTSATVLIASPAADGAFPFVTFSDNSLPNGQIGKQYATWIIADVESSNTVYSVSSGSLPAGLSLSPDGLLSGNPTEAVQNQSVTISTSDGQSHTFAITIHPVDYDWLSSGIWKYEVENDEAIIRFCTQQTGSVTVPETINGYPVRSIEAVHVADYDAAGVMTNIFIPQVVFFSDIWSVSLPSNLRNLGVGAVAVTSISSLTVPAGVTNIGHYAATSCSRLRSITLRSGLMSIGDAAFKDCISLQSAQIPNSVENMGVHVFNNCSSLLSASLSSGHGTVPAGTFANCQSLVDVVIPGSVVYIDKDAFSACTSLRWIDIPSSVRRVGQGAFASCVSLGEFRSPSALESIGDMCFLGCLSLTNFVASPLIDGFLLATFAQCESLGEICLPPNCHLLGKGCFSGCSSLTNVIWNGRMEVIDEWAFENCAALESLCIPDSVSTVKAGALRGCTNLVSLSIPFVGITTNYMVETDISGFGAIFGANQFEGGIETTQVFGSAGDLAATWFIPASLETVEVRGGMLAPGAFSDCRTLKEIRLAGSPTAIPNFAFFGCDGLEEISIPHCVTNIGYAAFGNCGSLRSIRMPTNVETVGSVPLWQCTNLVNVTWGETGRLRMENPDAGWFGLENVYISDGVSGLIWSVSTENPRDWIEWLVEETGELRTTDHYAIITNGETRSFFVRITDMSMTAADTELLHFTDDASAPWIVSKDESARGGFCLRSGEIPASTNSAMEATVCGKGTFSFRWCISAGRGDFCKFFLDGVEQASITRSTAWQTVTLDIPAGEHTVRWSYERGTGSATGEDAAFLDDVDWRPEVSLAVASAFGTAKPDAGTHTFVYGDEVVASVVAPEPENGTRRVCTGWMGTGSAPVVGVESNVLFTITNDTSIVWNWRTDYLTGVSVSGGSGNFGPQWVASGETVEVALSPTAHLYEISLSGDTDGVTLDGTTLRFVADKPRQIDVTITEVKVSLAVDSEWGIPSPTNGVHDLSWGTQVSATIAEPEPTNGFQYVCTGWTGMGSVPESGTGTNEAFTIESDSSIQWNWQTNVWISIESDGPVGIDVVDGWFALGETVVAHYSPNVDFFTLALSGDTDGVVLDESARTIVISADRPRSVTLSVAELTLKSALDAKKLSWETSGSATWFPQVAVSADGISSARSGSLSGGDDVSALETTVQGGGTFAWSWRLGVSGDSNSGVDVLLDGEWLDAYYPGTDWSRETLEITEDGTHTIRFEFWNAGMETGDCAYLDQVSWSGGVPSHGIVIGDVRIPSNWIDENAASALAKANGDYETAANAMAANKVNKVWECYVAGISPTDETARFEATIEIVGGKPVVRWNPPLSAEEEAKRIRKVLGKRSLDDPDGWQDMTNIDDIDAAGYRFFKVSVEMK